MGPKPQNESAVISKVKYYFLSYSGLLHTHVSYSQHYRAHFTPTCRTQAYVAEIAKFEKNVAAKLTKNKESAADQLLANGVNEYYSVSSGFGFRVSGSGWESEGQRQPSCFLELPCPIEQPHHLSLIAHARALAHADPRALSPHRPSWISSSLPSTSLRSSAMPCSLSRTSSRRTLSRSVGYPLLAHLALLGEFYI